MLVDTRKLADEDFIFTSFIGLSRHRNFEAAAGSLRGFHCSRSHQNQCFRLYLIDDQVSNVICCIFLLLWGFLHVKKWPICASFDCCFDIKICQKFGHYKIPKVGNTDKDRGNKSGSWSRTSVRLPPSMLSVISIWPIFYTFFFRWCKNCVNKGKLAKVFGFDRLLLHFCLII